jgi:hypothetical protein
MLEVQLKEGREQLKEGREKSIVAMRQSVENTVRNANGQTVERIVKNKELRMTVAALTKPLRSLLDRQGYCCELTKIPFHFAGPEADDNLRPSVDRIDRNGHYEGEGGTPPHGAGRTSPSEADISLMAKPLRSSTRLADPA